MADDDTEGQGGAEMSEEAAFADALGAANLHVLRDEPEAAFEICASLLQGAELTWTRALQISGLLAKIEQNALAADVQKRVLEAIDQALQSRPDDPEVLKQAGLAYLTLQRSEPAIAALERSFALEPADMRVGMRLSIQLLSEGKVAEARAVWAPPAALADDPATRLLLMAQLFAKYGHTEDALRYLAQAKPHCDAKIRVTHDIIEAALHGRDIETEQHERAIQLFDAFSGNYDDVLEGLGNNGPQLTARALHELKLAPEGKLRVLDAGCGTGLCAPFLWPYARKLYGCDISIGMLQKARDKGVYHFLTRTDLADPATYPEGAFDLVVSNDTLVYFDKLDPFFDVISERVVPGGWLIFTVEEATGIDENRGYQITPSGRFSHSERYVRAKLAQAGFDAPQVMLRDTLRTEFKLPVAGLSVAAQRLA